MASGAHNRHICRDGNGYGCWGGTEEQTTNCGPGGAARGRASAQRTELLNLFGDTLADSPAAGAVGHDLNAGLLICLCSAPSFSFRGWDRGW